MLDEEDLVTTDSDPGDQSSDGLAGDEASAEGRALSAAAHWFDEEHEGIDAGAWEVDADEIWGPRPTAPTATEHAASDAGREATSEG